MWSIIFFSQYIVARLDTVASGYLQKKIALLYSKMSQPPGMSVCDLKQHHQACTNNYSSAL